MWWLPSCIDHAHILRRICTLVPLWTREWPQTSRSWICQYPSRPPLAAALIVNGACVCVCVSVCALWELVRGLFSRTAACFNLVLVTGKHQQPSPSTCGKYILRCMRAQTHNAAAKRISALWSLHSWTIRSYFIRASRQLWAWLGNDPSAIMETGFCICDWSQGGEMEPGFLQCDTRT